jgi:hypothetical protein
MGDIVSNEFNKLEWYKKIGIFGKEPLEATPQVIAEALKRAGNIVRERYGENVFQGQLGPKIHEDLKNLKVGSEFRIVEKDFLIVITGAYTGYRVEVGFTREQPKIAFVEGKSRINASLGLKFLGAGD